MRSKGIVKKKGWWEDYAVGPVTARADAVAPVRFERGSMPPTRTYNKPRVSFFNSFTTAASPVKFLLMGFPSGVTVL